MEKTKILIVDDNETTRNDLKEKLEKHKFQVKSFSSGEKAIDFIKTDQTYEVLVIDHFLKKGEKNGIETTKIITEINQEIFPIIFTFKAFNKEKLNEHRIKAYEAGAYRYFERPMKGSENEVLKFANEIKYLKLIRRRVRKFYDNNKKVPSLLNQLNIMVSVIDRYYKIWYLNPLAKEFLRCNEIPKTTCAYSFSGCMNAPCKDCNAEETFSDNKTHQKIYLHSFLQYNNKLKWVQSWTQPILDEKGFPILTKDNSPVAVLESARDITDTPYLNSIPTEERYKTIANSIINRDSDFIRVRIYEKFDKILKVISSSGYDEIIEGKTINHYNYPYLRGSINTYIKINEGSILNVKNNPDPLVPKLKMENFIHWPLMKGKELLGLISVTMKKEINEEKLQIIKEYAHEALKIIKSQKSDTLFIDNEIEAELFNIESKCNEFLFKQNIVSKDVVKELINDLAEKIKSDEIFFRFIKDKEAHTSETILLDIGRGSYYTIAPKSLLASLEMRNNPVIRVLLTGSEEINNLANKDELVLNNRLKGLPENAIKVLKQFGSYCFVPLIFNQKYIGVLGIYQFESGFFDDKKLEYIRIYSKYLAPFIYDYLVIVEYLEKINSREELAKDIAMRAIHNIRTPASKILAYLSNIKKDFQLSIKLSDQISKIEKQMKRISELSTSFLTYTKPIEINNQRIYIDQFLDIIIDKQDEIKIKVDKRENNLTVLADEQNLKWVFEEMITNARKNGALNINIVTNTSDNEIIISVINDGKDIDDNIKNDIFKPFVSCDPMGTGLGLSNIEKILKQFHGRIELNTNNNKSVRFDIFLPLIR